MSKKAVRAMSKRERMWGAVAHLDGQTIGIMEAVEEYNLTLRTIYSSLDKGYIRELGGSTRRGRGNKRLVNRADVAYIALLSRERGRGPGKRLFNPDTIPPHVAIASPN